MTRDFQKLPGILALGLLAVPYVLLFAAGSVWLFQTRLLLAWVGIALVCTGAGWYLLRSFWRRLPPPTVQPDLDWPPKGLAVWGQVERLAKEIEAEEFLLDHPEQAVAMVRRVLNLVARHYHPQAKDPWLETPFPHVLRIVELAAADLRRAMISYVPASHILTIGDLRRMQRLAGMAQRTYFWYRVGSFLINAPAAFLREARDAVFSQLRAQSTEGVKRWAIGFFVRRSGYYAIQLYGRHINLGDAPAADSPLTASRRDARGDLQRTEMLAAEPLRILVVGQTKAGKSSLVNALFGDYRAATDVVPRTDRVEPYVLRRGGLDEVLLLDTAGYDYADPAAMLREWVDRLHGCDLVIFVCSAASAAREADRRLLAEMRAEFQRETDRHMPVVIAALTHIDRLRPVQEWNPPYRLDPPEGAKAKQIADAVLAVADDLGLPAEDVVPACLLPERMYNVEEALVPAIINRLPAAQRVKYVRCLRQRRDEEYWQRLWQQTLAAGQVLRGLIQKR